MIAFNDGWVFNEGFSTELTTALGKGKTVTLPAHGRRVALFLFRRDSLPAPLHLPEGAHAPIRRGRARRCRSSSTAPWRTRSSSSTASGSALTRTATRRSRCVSPASSSAGDNLLAIKIDGSENPDIPPFGGRIDYLTYAGIYRDVWLKVTPPVSIGSVKIETPDVLADEEVASASASSSTNPQQLPLGGYADGDAARRQARDASRPLPRRRRPRSICD